MKRQLLFTIALFSSAFLSAQEMYLPNGQMTDWLNGDPVFWTTNNLLSPGAITEVSGNGGAGARGEAFTNNIIQQVVPPLLVCNGNGDTSFDVDQDYTYVSFDYKLDTNNGDELFFALTLSDGGAQVIGTATATIPTNTNNWTTYTAAINYNGSGAVTGAFYLTLTNGIGGTVTAGSTFHVDNIKLSNSGSVNVEEESNTGTFSFAGVYPNPASDVINLDLNMPASGLVATELIDLSGRTIDSQSLIIAAGPQRPEIPVSELPAGLYLLRLKYQDEVVTKRVRIVR